MSRFQTLTRFWWSLAILAALAVVIAVAIPAVTARGADHLDAPGLTSPGGDGRLDINDVFVFQSPNEANSVTIIMTVNPGAGPISPITFHPEAKYELLIDNDADAKFDTAFVVTFSEPDNDGEQDVKLRQKGGSIKADGHTGEDISVRGSGEIGTLHAGLFDDPFFFDLNAFLGAYAFCNAPGGPADSTGDDFFAGLNVSAIVLEIPRSALGGDSIGVWGRTVMDGQIDRMGRPAINTVFIPEPSKNAFNEGKPKDDAADFSVFLGAFAGLLLPDILTVDTSNPAGFLNGRQLPDDVIDAELGLIGIPPGSDCVDTNDVSFEDEFPYLAAAHGA